ncbi:peptidylprolyl isomerase [Flavobacterium sp. NKUCC04_CG]|uniref:peptidylprolyl isomerase n=1 Tax=Flavobacterium sp. NKUCC04_CG TaxID=2842121 RepID=UPI001C5B69EA|nr:peptidylprolyl isomerase [Flavobacterium sp. NKUCC04_CG]MBW3519845.1 peptidylprolyl isomerase [Flavobacterium sp. NKUCC04_CG]
MMKRYAILFKLFFLTLPLVAQSHKLAFKTPQGVFKVVLYDFTPRHQQLILESVKNSVYHDALFNRIIKNFVVQGGEHDDDIALRESDLPVEQRVRLAPEIDKRAFHKIGALGAGRDDNPQKASFLNQIYFVVGKPVSEAELAQLEIKKSVKFTAEQRKHYREQGGLPRLDGDYTIFGEVYEGFEVLMEISQLQTNAKDAPIDKIPFQITEITD